ncbi:uncharacterized protein LOC131440556 [Malaya genurostris]|uniref:uncharacterized protein LOC131440556 n=1 Tax=Malaya genurostris TaxID=325434 RepID=UPI0026F3D1E6|nr:uncharacterized protein LOC131440556 [Malaya genurostris]XP_058467920.1 uncharacterized protein LOC131440556 [Malaya genurostris]
MMDTVSSSTDRSLQQNPAVRRRQMRQKVLNRIRKVNIKNKGAKSFYYFIYESGEVERERDSPISTYFFNGEPCEGDEQFLKQMKHSIFVSNLAAGTKKTEIKELFERCGRISSIQLKTRNGQTIVGLQHISPYSPIVAIIKFSKKEEAVEVCNVKGGKFHLKLIDPSLQYEKQNCIRVDNVDPKISKFELLQYFKDFGTIIDITLETNDGSVILTDKEYQKLNCVCCYVRFTHRNEAKVAKEMNGFIFKDRKLRVELAYQKHCDPNKISNNALRMFFQSVGDVIALDQIPQQHMGYVCYKNPLPMEIIKRLSQRIYRNKKIHLEKLDTGNIVKGQKLIKASNEPGNGDIATSSAADTIVLTSLAKNSGAVSKKAKLKTVQKKSGSSEFMGATGMTKKKLPRKNAAIGTKVKPIEKALKLPKEELC